MRSVIFILSAIVVFQPSCALPQRPDLRIVNGQEATPHSLPYQVYLNVTRPLNSSPCGGSLISQRFVLTAAHCIQDGSDATVYLGAHNIQELESTQIRILATKFIIHENYDGFVKNDIALIELDLPFEFTDAIQPIDLISRDQATAIEGREALMSGWGLISSTNSSPVLLQATGTITDHSDSRCAISTASRDICWLGASSACSGDSGGPLVVDGRLVGIVSYGDVSCSPDTASFFVRVSSYLDWIELNSDVTAS